MEIQPVTSPYPVSDFLNWDASNQLVLSPRFQRRRVWLPKAQSYLIDTILKQMPIPPIFLRHIIDPVKRSTIREVVDGQQRIGTIFDFIRGKFTVLQTHNPDYGGLTYSELPENIQRGFLSYKLSVSILEGVSDEDVLKIFARLNTYTVPLNKQELRNADYFGAFKQTVYDTAFKHLAFWRNNNILTDYEIARMADAEFTSELLSTMMGGFRDTKDKALRNIYKDYDDEFPRGAELSTQFETTIDTIGGIFGSKFLETPYRRAPLFFSLFMFVYDALYGLPSWDSPRLNFSSQERASILSALTKLGEIMRLTEPPEHYLNLVEATRRGTADIGKRRTRHQYIWEAVRETLK